MKDSQKPMTKTEIISALAERSELEKQQVASILDGLAGLIQKSLGDGGPGIIRYCGSANKAPSTAALNPPKNCFLYASKSSSAFSCGFEVKTLAV